MRNVLKYINSQLSDLPYEYDEWTSKVKYPYFVGSMLEGPVIDEAGEQIINFTLDGFTRGSMLEMEVLKETIRNKFPAIGGKRAILEDGAGIAIFYAGSSPIPTGEEGLKRIQINLEIHYWKVG